MNTENILYQDTDLLVVNKPSGTTSEALLVQLQGAHCINRLDQRVSGAMLIAKNKKIAALLQAQIGTPAMVKKYKAIVAQTPKDSTAKLIHWLVKNSFKTKTFDKPTTNAKRAILQYNIAQQTERYCMLQVQLETGRFHQIRAQLAAIGSPIVGDLKYGYSRSSKDGSIFLQSNSISFTHPNSNKKLSFQIAIPEAWKQYGFVDDVSL